MNVPSIPLELFPAIFEHVPHPLWLARADGFMESVNAEGLEYFGIPLKELRGWSWLQIVHPADRENTLHAWVEATTEGRPFQIEFRIMTAQGRFRWNNVCASPVAGGDGKIAAFVGNCTDVDDWKQSLRDLSSANREIEELEALVRLLETRTAVGFCYLDSELRYTRINDLLALINGLPTAVHKGKRVREVVPKLWPSLKPHIERVVSTKAPILDTTVDGETPAQPGVRRQWRVSYFPVVHAGEFLGVALIVTELRGMLPGQFDRAEIPEVEGKCIRDTCAEQLPS